MDEESKFYHNFAKEELKKKGFIIKSLNEDYMNERLNEIMQFVNGILNEFSGNYKLWKPKPKEWFLNPMNNKWKYSSIIENEENEICLINFTSVYSGLLHTHCTYVNKKYRNLGLNKLHKIEVCQTGLENNFLKYEGIWDKYNNGSIILYLRLGFKIESMRNDEQIVMVGNLEEIRNKAFNLYKKDN